MFFKRITLFLQRHTLNVRNGKIKIMQHATTNQVKAGRTLLLGETKETCQKKKYYQDKDKILADEANKFR